MEVFIQKSFFNQIGNNYKRDVLPTHYIQTRPTRPVSNVHILFDTNRTYVIKGFNKEFINFFSQTRRQD